MAIAIILIARNEGAHIARTLTSLGRQTALLEGQGITVTVFANGCSDQTAAIAAATMASDERLRHLSTRVEVSEKGGKSRSWNTVVHSPYFKSADLFIFCDADISFADDTSIEMVISKLTASAAAVACSGRPVKSIALKDRPNMLERLSLRVSSDADHGACINGSLYAILGSEARGIWMPDETPVEDGFLNAMIKTDGFAHPPIGDRVVQVEHKTHYFDAPGLRGTFRHERRLFVGTAVNQWLFEHLWSLDRRESVGGYIAEQNAINPRWVEKIVIERTAGKKWVVPANLVFGRLPRVSRLAPWTFLTRLPMGLLGTLFNLPVALSANTALKQKGAASIW